VVRESDGERDNNGNYYDDDEYGEDCVAVL
jgi:hypothetical protein